MKIALLVLALCIAACAETPGDKVARDLQQMKDERTSDKLVERGRAFAAVGDLTRAEQYLAAALDEGADEDTVLPELLRVCIEAKRYRVAIDYATPVLRRKPNDAKLRFVVASLRSTIGDAEGAKADMLRVLALKPNDPSVRFSFAVMLRDQLSDPAAADEQFRAYLRLAPTGVHVDEAKDSLMKEVTSTSASAPVRIPAPAPVPVPASAPVDAGSDAP